MVERTRIVEEAEARQLPTLIDEWWDAPDHRRWLARALRIDLALLTERPDLVVPCLHRLCAWPGAPGEAAFYRQRSAPPPEAAALREVMQGWQPGAPWQRALRPPAVPLDAGVVEEYRTSIEGELAFSADGAAIGVIGEDGAIGWERATGRRLTSPRHFLHARPRSRRWQDLASTWGTLVFASEERRVAIDISDDEIARSSWELGPGLVLVDLDDIEMEHRPTLIDLARGRIVWQSSGECQACALLPGRGELAIALAGGIEVLDLETGQVRGSWAVPDVSALAVAPDGLIATRSHSVIRAWNRDIAAAHTCSLAGTWGWDFDERPAEFSIDGARLITGNLLCDAPTGALVAHLDARPPRGFLMGGPPRHYHRLTTTVFAQIIFGVTLWDTRDGTCLVEDQDRHASASDLIAFDAIGLHHAIAYERGGIRVYRLRSGERVFDHAAADVKSLGFSPDGASLWWETLPGVRWIVELPGTSSPPGDNPTARQLSGAEPVPAEPEPRWVKPEDGLLIAGAAAIPCDDPRVVASLDGRQLAGLTSHYALEER